MDVNNKKKTILMIGGLFAYVNLDFPVTILASDLLVKYREK